MQPLPPSCQADQHGMKMHGPLSCTTLSERRLQSSTTLRIGAEDRLTAPVFTAIAQCVQQADQLHEASKSEAECCNSHVIVVRMKSLA